MLKAPEPSVSPNSSLAEDDDDDTNPNNEDDADGQPPHVRPIGSGGSAFHSFAPKAQGVLFKISPLSEKASADIEAYVREGTMNRDLIYVDTLYGIVAPSQSREYSMFWESPWVEEQIKETGKKRKILEQQRTMADTQDVDRYLSTVDRLNDWERHSHTADDTVRESVKTVSRMVQSFEKKAVLSLLTLLQSGGVRNPGALHHLQRLQGASGDIDPVTHALRRAPLTYIAFATLVAAELVISEANSGSKNVTINTARRMEQERFHAINTVFDILSRASPTSLPIDTLGLPLMQTSAHICISKGVLVVTDQNSTQATYILEINGLDEILARRPKRANKGLDVLQITAQIFEETDAKKELRAQQQLLPEKTRQQKQHKQSQALASLV